MDLPDVRRLAVKRIENAGTADLNRFLSGPVNHVIAEGNIGQGKSTFLENLLRFSKRASLVKEDVDRMSSCMGYNPLQLMYEGKLSPVEFQMILRTQQEMPQIEDPGATVLWDRLPGGTSIPWAAIHQSDPDAKQLIQLAQLDPQIKRMRESGLFEGSRVVLTYTEDLDTDRLLANIRYRNRVGEQSIDDKYLRLVDDQVMKPCVFQIYPYLLKEAYAKQLMIIHHVGGQTFAYINNDLSYNLWVTFELGPFRAFVHNQFLKVLFSPISFDSRKRQAK